MGTLFFGLGAGPGITYANGSIHGSQINVTLDLVIEFGYFLLTLACAGVNLFQAGKCEAASAGGAHIMQIWARDLSDGAKAVGLFNTGAKLRKITLNLATLSWRGKHKIRDLWLHQDLGEFDAQFAADVSSHGVVLIKIFPSLDDKP